MVKSPSVFKAQLKTSSRKPSGTLLPRHSLLILPLISEALKHVLSHSVVSDYLQLHGLKPSRLLSMGFSRQEYWSGLPCHLPGDLPDPGIKPASLMFPALAGGFFTTNTTWEGQQSIVRDKSGRDYFKAYIHGIFRVIPWVKQISMYRTMYCLSGTNR